MPLPLPSPDPGGGTRTQAEISAKSLLQLEDAEHLLAYAAETGIDVGDDVRRAVVVSRLAAGKGWTEEQSVQLLGALTTLAAKLKPVTGESLRKCAVNAEASKTIFRLWVAAVSLFVVIVPFSVAAFVASATCEAIRKDIETANGLTVTLGGKARHAPAAAAAGDLQLHGEREIKELQQLAAIIRAVDRRAMQLAHFGFYAISDPLAAWRGDPAAFKQRFQLPSRDLVVEQEIVGKIDLYQDVRSFAQSVQEMVQTSFGAVTACVLPMLYALLGACAFLIRSFEEQRRARTFTASGKLNARLLIAAIGGLVVGLFGNFGEGHTVGLSPLAIAFTVGYAVDVFFYFIDGLLHTFGRPAAPARESEPGPIRATAGK